MNQALKAAATGKAAPTIFDFLQHDRVKKGIAAVAGKYLGPEKMLTLCVNAVKKTPALLKCEPSSVLGAMMASASLQLEPNTVQQQAFLIPYKRRAKVGNEWVDVFDCQFQVGARGFVTLAYRSPLIASIEAHAIRKGDHWKHRVGSQAFLEYEPALEDRGDLRGAFSYVRLREGSELACVLPLDEVLKIRARSETFRTLSRYVEQAQNDAERKRAEEKLLETPWIAWADDMFAKSATKKHAKQLPLTGFEVVAAAADLDDKSDAGVIDLGAFTDPDVARAVAAGEADPPQIEHDTSDRSLEGFGQQQRAREAVEAKPVAAADQAKQPKSKKPAPDPARENAAGKSYAACADEITKAKDREHALMLLDESREHLAPELLKDLAAHVDRTFPEA